MKKYFLRYSLLLFSSMLIQCADMNDLKMVYKAQKQENNK